MWLMHDITHREPGVQRLGRPSRSLSKMASVGVRNFILKPTQTAVKLISQRTFFFFCILDRGAQVLTRSLAIFLPLKCASFHSSSHRAANTHEREPEDNNNSAHAAEMRLGEKERGRENEKSKEEECSERDKESVKLWTVK